MSVIRPIVLAVLFVVGVYAFIKTERQQGKRFVNSYKVMKSRSVLSCLNMCSREIDKCFGINFRADKTVCELIGRDRTSVLENGWQSHYFTGRCI